MEAQQGSREAGRGAGRLLDRSESVPADRRLPDAGSAEARRAGGRAAEHSDCSLGRRSDSAGRHACQRVQTLDVWNI